MKRGLRSKALVGQRRKILLQKVAALSFIVVFVISSYAILSQLEAVTITTINVHGNDIVSVEELTDIAQKEIDGDYFHLFSRSNILLFSENSIAASIYNSYKRIKKVTVGRNNINTIYITVEERSPYGLWCEENCYFLDNLGYIFAEAPEFTGNVFFTYLIPIESNPIGIQVLPEKEFTEIGLLLNSFRDLGLDPINLSLEGNDYEVLLEDESKIMFSRDQDLAEVSDSLTSVLGEIDGLLEYIDFRFGSKVYYRYVE